MEYARNSMLLSLIHILELEPSDLKQKTVRLPKYQALYLDQLIRDFEIAPVKESEELAGCLLYTSRCV